MTNQARLYTAMRDVVDPVVRIARQHGPLPAITEPRWLTSPLPTRLATLLIAGEARVFEDLEAVEMVDRWLGLDYLNGQFHRANHVPLISEMDKRRYPPTGDRSLWIRYGTAGPPAALEAA